MEHALRHEAWARLLSRYSELPANTPCQLSVPMDLQLSPVWCVLQAWALLATTAAALAAALLA